MNIQLLLEVTKPTHDQAPGSGGSLQVQRFMPAEEAACSTLVMWKLLSAEVFRGSEL